MSTTGPLSPPPPSAGPTTPPPQRTLRRSSTDHYAAGVCGGLGEFFAVDPVLFRVLFVALSFVGGIGVVAYLACWIAIPESGAQNSALDHWIASIRNHNVPLWLVGVVAAAAVWVGLFSWWSPLHIVPVAVIGGVIAIAVMALTRRPQGSAAQQGPVPQGPVPQGPTQPTFGPSQPAYGPQPYYGPRPSEGEHATPGDPTVDLTKNAEPAAESVTQTINMPATDAPPSGTRNATAPLPTASAQLRDWWAAETERRSARARRGRVTELVADGLMFAVWLTLAIVSASTPIPVQAFLWSAFGILLAATIIGAAIRRPRWRLLVGVAFLSVMLAAIGNYAVRIGDPTGQHDVHPTTVADIDRTYRMLAGDQKLDLSQVNFDGKTVNVTVRQGAGHLKITVPRDVTVHVDAHDRYGQLDIFDDGIGGLANNHEETYPAAAGSIDPGTLRLDITLLAGQVQIVRG